jgi:pyridoxine 5-phosphate synthase
MTVTDSVELTVVLDSVFRMREQQLWPHPDPLEFALAAEAAGIDSVLLSLQIAHVAARDRGWQTLSELRRAKLCLAVPPRTDILERVAASAAARCVLIPGARSEHSSGGALAVDVLRETIAQAAALFVSRDIELGARIDPDPAAVEICADAGLRAVEINTSAYALATRPGSRARRLAELAAAAQAAEDHGLHVAVRAGLDFENIGALTGCGPIAEVRIGQALIARAMIDGIAASIARMRDLLGG